MGWFYKLGDTEHGPVSQEEIIAAFKAGDIDKFTHIKEDDSFAWRALEATEIGEALGFVTIEHNNIKGEPLPYDPEKVIPLGWRSVLLMFATWMAIIGALGLTVSAAVAVYQIATSIHDVKPPSGELTAFELSMFAYFLFFLVLSTGSFLGIFGYCFTYQRAMKNIRFLGAHESTISPIFTWVWFFVPFANLVMPAKAMSQIWHASHRLSGLEIKAKWAIPTWWSGWLIYYFAGRISDVYAKGSITDDAYIVDPPNAAIGMIFAFISAFAILLSSIALLRITQIIASLHKQLGPAKMLSVFD